MSLTWGPEDHNGQGAGSIYVAMALESPGALYRREDLVRGWNILVYEAAHV
jgi:hypothetical protein